MTKSFEEKIIREGVVDTAKYRYVADIDFSGVIIRRIPINLLDTTAALKGHDSAWEVVRNFSGISRAPKSGAEPLTNKEADA